MKSILFVVSCLLVAGCSAHVDGASPDFSIPVPQKSSVFRRAAVPGPNLVGTWASNCVVDSFGQGYRKASMQFLDGASFKYVNTTYSDRDCTTLTKQVAHAGVYQFSAKISDTLYVIDYNYVEDGVTYMMDNDQKVELSESKIYLTEFVWGTTDVTHDVPFNKVVSADADRAGNE